jgi:hypothetical protein
MGHRKPHFGNFRMGRTAMVAGALFTLLISHAARAQEVGTVAALEGRAEIGRAGGWTAAVIGSAVNQGDQLRTGKPGRLRVVFQDDTVLTVTDDSRVVVDQQVFDPAQGKTRSVLELLGGKVSALVGEYYHRSGATYEIKTVTAVAGVRGTEFVVQYNAGDDVTEVVGLSGKVEVHSASEPRGRGVFVSPREQTRIVHGRLPTVPTRLSDKMFRQYIEGIEFVGGGVAESLTTGHPLLAGASVPKPDRAVAITSSANQAHPEAIHDPRDASGLIQQPPGVFEGGGKLRITF